ncbi:helix-turn-helix transcriptional regulator [Bacillus bombysepticus]|uniref:helix-turn-helix domain-containing protein n=1 Tax=Bacillus bombysepticus TaxID=658666 RepID=UPI00301821F7
MTEKIPTQHINTDSAELRKPTDLKGADDGFVPSRAKYLMQKHKLRHEDIAELIGVDRSTITGYLIGNRVPPIGKIVKMAKVLHTSPDYLMGYSNIEAADLTNLQDVLSAEGLKWDGKVISAHHRNQITAIVDALCKTSR